MTADSPAADLDLGDRELAGQLRGPLRAMLAKLSPPEQVLAQCEQGTPYDRRLWTTLAGEMGLAGLVIPEPYGGAGAGWREAAVVQEELGRVVAPAPYLGSAVMATAALLAVEDGELLTGLASGELTAAVAVPFGTGPGGAAAPVRASGGLLTGQVARVADAYGADVLLVPSGDGLYAVPGDGPGVTRTAVSSLDLTRPLCDLSLAGAPGRRLVDRAGGELALQRALTAGAGLLAAEQLGLAQWCLDTTVEYVKSRHQFGRPVGSFQAVKHRLADVWMEVIQARAVAGYAAACLDESDPDTAVAVALAQAYCGPVALRAAEACVQLHGGIGFTWEHPAHLYLKRAKSVAVALGSAERHRHTLAALANLPPPSPPI